MRWAAAVWLVGALGYFLAEFLAIRAFSPSYSVAHNFISDLGVPECGQVFQGRPICSPRHSLMNAAFALEGASFLVGALFTYAASGHRRSVGFPIFAALFCLGMSLIAVFHGANAAAANGTFALHVSGALLAIICGNVAMLLSRRSSEAVGRPSAQRCASLALVTLSLFAFVVLAAAQLLSETFIFGAGIWERAILYPILAWQLVRAINFLRRST